MSCSYLALLYIPPSFLLMTQSWLPLPPYLPYLQPWTASQPADVDEALFFHTLTVPLENSFHVWSGFLNNSPCSRILSSSFLLQRGSECKNARISLSKRTSDLDSNPSLLRGKRMLAALEKILFLIKIKENEMKESVNSLAHHEPCRGVSIARMFFPWALNSCGCLSEICTKPHRAIF